MQKSAHPRHPRESGDPERAIARIRVTRPADAGRWIPACAGMTLLLVLLAFASIARAEPAIDQPAPPLAAKELDGSTFDLGKLKGRVVLVHFWATWCPACREEMSALEEFYRNYHARGVEIIAVSIDKPNKRDAVTEMMKPLTFPAAMLEDVTENGFGKQQVLPVTYIIDRDGNVVLSTLSLPDDQLLTAQILSDNVEPLLNTPKKGK